MAPPGGGVWNVLRFVRVIFNHPVWKKKTVELLLFFLLLQYTLMKNFILSYKSIGLFIFLFLLRHSLPLPRAILHPYTRGHAKWRSRSDIVHHVTFYIL